MISSVNSNIVTNYTMMGNSRHRMSADQKNAVENILSKYDASSLSRNDAKEISDSFKKMGIRPGNDLRQTIENAGFDADRLRALSGAGGIQMHQPKQPPTPPPPTKDDNHIDIWA